MEGIMDFIRDESKRTWIKLASMVTVPSYVKEEIVLDTTDMKKMAANEFADIARHIFPIGTPGNTWLSAMYFHVNKDNLGVKKAEVDYIASRLYKAVDTYGIREDVGKAISELSTSVKVAASNEDDAYGWVVKDASGKVTARRYRIEDARGVTKAASYFSGYRFQYPFDTRRQIGKFIFRKAAQYGIDIETLPGCVVREAGYGVPNIDRLKDEIERRSLLCKDADVKAVFNNLSTVIELLPVSELTQGLDKLAETIDHFDHIVGLHNEYGRGILSPADIVYSMPLTKTASDLDNAVKLAAYVFDVRKLAALGVDVFGCMGSEFTDAVVKEGSVDPSLLLQEIEKLSALDRHILESELRKI
jgi:hypothetical protein